MLTKTQIKDLSKKHNFYLKKRLGQNFLIDKNIRDKIARLLDLKKDDIILEIGPGLGAITEELVRRCRYVYVVEKDKKMCGLLKELLSDYKNLIIIDGDFLKFDINCLPLKDIKIKVIGLLPYYITTPIIQHLLNYRKMIDTIFITVQKEVARRLAARAGEDDYSSLSLFIQFYSDIDLLMSIKRDSFFPRPDVDSTLVKLKILPQPHVTVRDEGTLFKVIRTSFNQRRKTLTSTLSQKNLFGLDKGDLSSLLESLGIDKKSRAETLTLEQFAKISDAIIDFLM